jgi:RNA 2',3'-cyclic 3'-phosphodiesterase
VRLFVAVEVPEGVRGAVWEAVAPLRSEAPKLKWVAPERYHLTLVFLGSVGSDLVAGVVAALRSGCDGVAPFSLALDGTLGTFGRRVLWAGLAPSSQLSRLASAVGAALAPVVPVPDAGREYRAHLTLARAGREPVRGALVRGVTVPTVSWPVERVVLMESAGGYRVVEAVELRG